MSPIPEPLHDDLRAWQEFYNRHAEPPLSPGVSVFPDAATATSFVEWGQAIVAKLASELGDDWHVE